MAQSAPIQLLSLLRAREDQLHEIERIAFELIQRAEQEKVCRGGELQRDMQDPTRYALSFDFNSEEQLQTFLQADWRLALLRELPGVAELETERYVLEAVPVDMPAG